jgi:hypothetical protein
MAVIKPSKMIIVTSRPRMIRNYSSVKAEGLVGA